MEKKEGAGKGHTLHLSVITPEEQFFDGTVESVMLRTVDGYMGFLHGRAPFCALLHDEGRLRFRQAGSSDFVEAFLAGGFAFMDSLGEDLTIYTDSASWPEKLQEESKE